MKKSFLTLPAMICLFSFAENNNDRFNKFYSNEYFLIQQDPPENFGQAQFPSGPISSTSSSASSMTGISGIGMIPSLGGMTGTTFGPGGITSSTSSSAASMSGINRFGGMGGSSLPGTITQLPPSTPTPPSTF